MIKKIVCFLFLVTLPIQVFAEAINYKCSAKFGYMGAVGKTSDAIGRVDCSDSKRHILCFDYQVKIIDDYLFFDDLAPVKLIDIGSNAFYVPWHMAGREGISLPRAYTLRIKNDGSASIDLRRPSIFEYTAREYASEDVSFLDCKRQ